MSEHHSTPFARLAGALLLCLLAVSGPALAHDFGGDSTGGKGEVEGPSDPACNLEGKPHKEKAEPVSPFTGKWFYRHVDLEVPGIFPIELVRRYDSQTTYQSPLGAGWAYTYDWRLFEYADGSVTVRNACGQLHRYVDSGSGFTTGDAPGWRLGLAPDPGVPGGYVLAEPRGTKRFFDVQGRMTRIRDPQGNELRFTYGPTKQTLSGTSRYAVDPATPLITSHHYPLQKIEEATAIGTLTGRSVTFTYDPTSGRLVSALSHDGRGVWYTHQMVTVNGQSLTTGNLTQVRLETSPGGLGGIVQTFGYTDTTFRHAVTSFQDGAGRREVKNEYDAQGRVSKQRLAATPADVIVFEFDYAPTTFPYSNDFTGCGTSFQCRVVTEHIRNANDDAEFAVATTAYKFRADDGYPVAEIDAAGHRTDSFYKDLEQPPRPNYLDRVDVLRFVSASGGTPTRSLEKRTDFEFDLSGNLTSREVVVATAAGGSERITESWTYDQDWVSTHTIDSDAPLTGAFRESFTFVRGGLAPGEQGYSGTAPINNVHSVSRLHFNDTPVTTTFGYDANGRLERIDFPAGPPKVLPRFTAAQDGGGVIRNGLVWRRAHEVASAEDPHENATFDYDASGRIASVTDARNHETKLTWDALGRLRQIENPLGEQTELIYGSPDGTGEGWLLVQTETGRTLAGGEGRITKLVYDGLGNLTQVQRKTATGMAGFETFATFTNDTAGRRLTATDARSRTTTFGWDLLGRLASIEDAATPANVTYFAHDASGNRTKVTDAILPVGRVTNFVFDALDRLIRVEALGPDPDEITEFAYDAAGNVTKVTDPKDQETDYGFDALSRLGSVTQELGPPVRYEYDGRGRLERVTNARGQILHSFYHQWGALEKVVHDLNGNGVEPGEREVTYGYDPSGNLTSVSDSDSALGMLYVADLTTGYDALNRLHEIDVHYIPGGSVTLTHSYNRFGEREGLDLEQGAETLTHGWAFDHRGRLDLATFPGSAAIDFSPFPDDTLETITYPSGVMTGYGYHAQGPIDTVTVTATGGVQRLLLDYAVDAVQNVTDLIEQHASGEPAESYVFGYDGANRLTDANYPAAFGLPVNETFGYDLAGNRDDGPGVATPWSYDANNRLIASPAADVSCYDDDGNLTSTRSAPDTCASGTDTQTFTWDAQNRLRRYENPSTSKDVAYLYDPFGRRIRKTDGASTTHYLWDGDRLLAEYDGSGVRQVRYAYAGGFAPTQVAYRDGASEDVYDVHSDHLDTPKLLTDDAGSVAWRAAHEAFGKAALDAGNTVTFNIRFPGQYFDLESGLHDNRFRYFDPAIGRYISGDPIGQAGGINLFEYASSNPVGALDPFGLADALSAAANNGVAIPATVPADWSPFVIKERSIERARQEFPGDGEGNQDSFRHCLGACETARQNGSSIARAVGSANESLGNFSYNQSREEEERDKANNEVGIQCSEDAGSFEDCAANCKAALDAGRLRGSPGEGLPGQYNPNFPAGTRYRRRY